MTNPHVTRMISLLTEPRLRAVLAEFRVAGIHKVSPGAFGMVHCMQLNIKPWPFTYEELESVTRHYIWIVWVGKGTTIHIRADRISSRDDPFKGFRII